MLPCVELATIVATVILVTAMKFRAPILRIPASALAVLALPACEGADSPDRPATQVRDSAGIRIIENASPPEGSRLNWRIGSEPTLSIGEVDGDDPYLLYTWPGMPRG